MMDCKYFVWVDKIGGGWEGLSRALIGRTTKKQSSRTEAEDMDAAQLGATREIDLKIIMKMRKIHGEIKTVRKAPLVHSWGSWYLKCGNGHLRAPPPSVLGVGMKS
ncbi:hypothetical protein PIB30_072789 [Stylosanthes scabra]|uniref:Uncharacterized protein n=1 Tax=Stylosanthes scabra TaxID=79078 RepID=A0ABU6URX7_9FABA|nr:hypothetical protein [Stylosanthes scabra]